MAVEFFAQRTNGRLVPETQSDLEAQEELKAGVTYRITAKRAAGRSLQHHRLLFALIGIAKENYDGPISTETILATLKLRTGHVNVVALLTGEVIMIPRSISFQAMERDEFTAWFDRAVTVLCRDFVPGLAESMARAEIARRAGCALPVANLAPRAPLDADYAMAA